MKVPPLLIAVISATLAASGLAETVKDREAAVRGDKARMENDARWIYNDVARGFAEARRTGKPLLVVLRCVPCLACSGIDAQVLLQEDTLAPLLDQFVCVRLINANALDLALFQFDYDLSFSTLFFNADGTVYGRYGSWIHQKDAQEKSTASYRLALQGALDLHKGYPANKAALAGKQGGPTPFKVAIDLPALAEKYTLDLNWDGKVVQSCVHCHQVGDALRLSYREKRVPIPEAWIYPFPAPEVLGLALAPDQVASVTAVAPDSIAARAGVQPGDRLVSLAGQPLLSIADVSWALHRAAPSGPMPAVIERVGQRTNITFTLPDDWRRQSDISRRVGTWPMRGMALGGLVLEDIDETARTQRGLDPTQLALWVKSVGQYGKHAAAKNAGFQKDDIIVEIDNLKTRHTESRLLGHLLLKHPSGDKVPVTVLRGTERVTLTLPMQ